MFWFQALVKLVGNVMHIFVYKILIHAVNFKKIWIPIIISGHSSVNLEIIWAIYGLKSFVPLNHLQE